MTNTEFAKRRKVILITHPQLIRIITGHKSFQDHVVIPQPVGLPETAIVMGMGTFPRRSAYELVVCDESFDLVEDGVEAPELKLNWTTVDIQRPIGREKP